jgi:hypothetical protein
MLNNKNTTEIMWKSLLLILGAQVRSEEPNDMKLHMKWVVTFKRGKAEF